MNMERREIEPEYIYTTIPAEYVCVYHRIMAMLADYGEDMLKDCKAACKDRNSGVIECFNMFNAAVAARKIGKPKLAETLIKYIKAKINQIYKGDDNSTAFVFPIDENGVLKAFVSCNDRPRFFITGEELYKKNQGLGFEETYSIDDEQSNYKSAFDFTCSAVYEDGIIKPNIQFFYNSSPVEESDAEQIETEYYINGQFVKDLTTYEVTANMTISFKVVAYYRGDVRNHDYVIEVV